MKPTMTLRWAEASDADEASGIPCCAEQRAWPECGPRKFKLQQWWQNELTASGEWRDIPIG